jgi:Na+/H+ antiporter NhaA
VTNTIADNATAESPALVDGTLRPFQQFVATESAGGLLLIVSATLGLAWANSPYGTSYFALWDWYFTIGPDGFALTKPLSHWISDGLMVLFFLLVGLEIKREVFVGELSSIPYAALPIAAALGGMIVPAAIYAASNAGGAGARGWGIPMATDIAFALGVLSILGNRIPPALRLSSQRWRSWTTSARSWSSRCFMRGSCPCPQSDSPVSSLSCCFSAIEPAPAHRTQSPPDRRICDCVTFRIRERRRSILGRDVRQSLVARTAGVFLGLVVGKVTGIFLAARLAVRNRVAALPDQVIWRSVFGVNWLGGIGFTMSLFIATLAFGHGPQLNSAKLGILAGSVVSACVGTAILRKLPRAAE